MPNILPLPLPANLALQTDAARQSAFESFLALVCPALNVSSRNVMETRRRQADIIRARHCLIYLARTQLNLSLSQTARLFGRDRSTIRVCCAKIEDLREDPRFDHWLAEIEHSLEEEFCL